MESETSQLCLFVRIDECHLERVDRYCLVIQFGQEDACRTRLLDVPTDKPVFENNVAIFRLPFDMQEAWNQSIHIGLFAANNDSVAGQELCPIELGRVSFPLSDHFAALVSNVTAHRKSVIRTIPQSGKERSSLGSVYSSLWLYICNITSDDTSNLRIHPWFESSEPQQKETQEEGSDTNDTSEGSDRTSSLQLDQKLIKKWIAFVTRLFEENPQGLALRLHRFPIFQCPSTWISRFWYRSMNFMEENAGTAQPTYILVTIGSAQFTASEVDDCYRRFRLDLTVNDDSARDDEDSAEIMDTVFSIAVHQEEQQTWNQTLLLRQTDDASSGRLHLRVSVEHLSPRTLDISRSFSSSIVLSNLAGKIVYPVHLLWGVGGNVAQKRAVADFALQVIRSTGGNEESLSMLPRSIHSYNSGDFKIHEDIDIVGTLIPPNVVQSIQEDYSWRYVKDQTCVVSMAPSSKVETSVSAPASPRKKEKKGFSIRNLLPFRSKKANKYSVEEEEENQPRESEPLASLHEVSIPPTTYAFNGEAPIIIGHEDDTLKAEYLSELRHHTLKNVFDYAALDRQDRQVNHKKGDSNSAPPSPRSNSNKPTQLDRSRWRHLSQLSLSTRTHPASNGLNSLCHWRAQHDPHVSQSSSLFAGWGIMVTVRKRVHRTAEGVREPSSKVAYTPPPNCTSKQKTRRRNELANVLAIALASGPKQKMSSTYSKNATKAMVYSIEQSRHLQLTEFFADVHQGFRFPELSCRDLIYPESQGDQGSVEFMPIMRGFLRFGRQSSSVSKADHIAETSIDALDSVTPLKIPLFKLAVEKDVTSFNQGPEMMLKADVGLSRSTSAAVHGSVWDFAMKDAHADLSRGMEENLKRINTADDEDDDSVSIENFKVEPPESSRGNPFGLAVASACNIHIPDGKEPSLADLREAINECGSEIQSLRQALRRVRQEKTETEKQLVSLRTEKEQEAETDKETLNQILNDLSKGSSNIGDEYSQESLKKALLRLSERYQAEKKSRKQLQERVLAFEMEEGTAGPSSNEGGDAATDGGASEYEEASSSIGNRRPRYDVLLSKYKELEEAHTLQNEKLKKLQKQRAQIEQYRSTIKNQEQIITKMQQWISSKLKSKGQVSSDDDNTSEQSGELKRAMDKMQHQLSIKDRRIELLEQRLDENAREFSKQLTQMKMRLLDAGLEADFSSSALSLSNKEGHHDAQRGGQNESRLTNVRKHNAK